jgi:hypothetical protein
MIYNPRTQAEEGAMTVYKVVEASTVTNDELEAILNEWTAKGWIFDGIHFAMREASRRPAMAFVLFTREQEDANAAGR